MKQEIKQANFRLPEDLLNDLREVADNEQVSQTVIVREAISDKVDEIRNKKLVAEVAV